MHDHTPSSDALNAVRSALQGLSGFIAAHTLRAAEPVLCDESEEVYEFFIPRHAVAEFQDRVRQMRDAFRESKLLGWPVCPRGDNDPVYEAYRLVNGLQVANQSENRPSPVSVNEFLDTNPKHYLESIQCALDDMASGQECSSTASAQGNASSSASSIQLGRPGEPIMVLGHEMRVTKQQHNVIQALMEAGDWGLSKEELVTKSGHTDAVNILKRLEEKAIWASVICLGDRLSMAPK